MILDIYVLRKERSGGQIEDYMTLSEVEKIMRSTVKAAVEVMTRPFVTAIMEEPIDNASTAGFAEQNKKIKNQTRNMIKGASIEILEQCRWDIFLVCSVNKFGSWTCWRDELWVVYKLFRRLPPFSTRLLHVQWK